jgi:hypothetical protein
MRERVKSNFTLGFQTGLELLEDLGAEVEINSAWETIKEKIKISAKEGLGYFEMKKHKPWFNERCTELVDQRKQELQ